MLHADTATDLMMSNPVSIRAAASVREAVEMLTDRGIDAAPVIDEAGHPLGVLSRSDLLIHDRELVQHPRPDEIGKAADPAVVRDLMTPVVFTVTPRTPAHLVVEQMVALRVHQLFVVDESGVLVGVISALDVLRHLAP
jgi:CBS domain-containing protein